MVSVFQDLCKLSDMLLTHFLVSSTIKALFLSISVSAVISVGPCEGWHVDISSQSAILTSLKLLSFIPLDNAIDVIRREDI